MFMNVLFELCLRMYIYVYMRKYAVKETNIILTNHVEHIIFLADSVYY